MVLIAYDEIKENEELLKQFPSPYGDYGSYQKKGDFIMTEQKK